MCVRLLIFARCHAPPGRHAGLPLLHFIAPGRGAPMCAPACIFRTIHATRRAACPHAAASSLAEAVVPHEPADAHLRMRPSANSSSYCAQTYLLFTSEQTSRSDPTLILTMLARYRVFIYNKNPVSERQDYLYRGFQKNHSLWRGFRGSAPDRPLNLTSE